MGIFDGDDGERFKNLVLFKCYLTDKELDEALPYILSLFGIIALLGIAIYICKHFFR